jgi:hypothetical protein
VFLLEEIRPVLEFARPSARAKQFDVPAGPFGEPCFSARVAEEDQWERLREMAERYGWPV